MAKARVSHNNRKSTTKKTPCEFCGKRFPVGPGVAAHSRWCDQNPSRGKGTGKPRGGKVTKELRRQVRNVDDLTMMVRTMFPEGLAMTDDTRLREQLVWIVNTSDKLRSRI